MVLKHMSRCFSVVLLVVLMLSMAVTVQAAPDILPANVESTVAGLVTLKSPDQLSSSTTSKKLPISAISPQGTTVTVYRFNAVTGNYHKVWVGDTPLESVVGSTLLYAGQADLYVGKNKFLIRSGWDDYTYTVVKFDVNVLNDGFMDRIKGVINVIFG